MLAAVAQFERRLISERIKDAKVKLRRDGRHQGGTKPFGFQFGPVNGRGTAPTLIPDEREQAAIREIFAMREAGATLMAIRDAVRAMGHRISHQSVSNILARGAAPRRPPRRPRRPRIGFSGWRSAPAPRAPPPGRVAGGRQPVRLRARPQHRLGTRQPVVILLGTRGETGEIALCDTLNVASARAVSLIVWTKKLKIHATRVKKAPRSAATTQPGADPTTRNGRDNTKPRM